MSRGRLIQARYVPRSPAVPPCVHTPHVSVPPRRRGPVLSGLALLAKGIVVAAAAYATVLAILVAGAR